MSISVGDVLRVVAVLSWLDGNIMQNVFNAEIVGAGGPFDDGDVVDDAVEWMDDAYAPLVTKMSEDCDGAEVRVYKWDAIDEDWDEVGIDSWAFNPSSTAESLPRGVAGLVNAKSVNPDISGKKYMGALTEAEQVDGLLSAGEVTQLVLFATEWVQSFTGGTSGASWDPGIWSPTNQALYDMSNTIVVPSIPAYQRRRKRGVGI